MKKHAEFFAEEGYPVININYRLGEAGAYPKQPDDILMAMNYAVENYGAKRFIIWGFSWGATIGSLVSLAQNDAHTFGVESDYPTNAPIVSFIGAGGAYDYHIFETDNKYEERYDAYLVYSNGHPEESNTINHADSSDVPSLLIAGENDGISPREATEALGAV